jgi:hypothetical protein
VYLNSRLYEKKKAENAYVIEVRIKKKNERERTYCFENGSNISFNANNDQFEQLFKVIK